MTTLVWPAKDPDEVLDYTADWTARLGEDDTITTSTWSVVVGTVTIASQENETQTATVWLGGGTLGEICQLLNRVNTQGNRTMDQTIYLKIRKK